MGETIFVVESVPGDTLRISEEPICSQRSF